MRSGKVKWYSTEKGYGFILPDDTGTEIFVHYSALRESKLRALDEDQRVTFEAERNEPRGVGKWKAVKVLLA
jgi:CspA family cold shock protein